MAARTCHRHAIRLIGVLFVEPCARLVRVLLAQLDGDIRLVGERVDERITGDGTGFGPLELAPLIDEDAPARELVGDLTVQVRVTLAFGFVPFMPMNASGSTFWSVDVKSR